MFDVYVAMWDVAMSCRDVTMCARDALRLPIMPYRIDLTDPPDDAFDQLVDLGALDVEMVAGGLAAIIPDAIDVSALERIVGRAVHVGPARGRDAESVWQVRPRAVRIGRFEIIPADWTPHARALRMIDGPAFGTGLHATTALCLEALEAEIDAARPRSVLDVGTGSGVLALAALSAGVPIAHAVDVDAAAIRTAAENARLNGLASRLRLVQGGPEALSSRWPLVLANVLAAPLIALARPLTRRVGHRGRLIVSGVRASLAREVEAAYVGAGMRQVHAANRDGWTTMTFHASW